MKEKSLLGLRKTAQTLGIENYGKYSKTELIEQIKLAGGSPYEDEAAKEAEEKEFQTNEKIVAEKEEAGEVEEISAEAAANLPGVKKTKAEEKKEEKAKKAEEKAAAKAAKEKTKKEKVKKEPKVKAPKTVEKTFFTLKPGVEKTELGPTSQRVFDELLKNTGNSLYQVAKICDTYYSVAEKVVLKYFDVEKKKEVVEPETHKVVDDSPVDSVAE